MNNHKTYAVNIQWDIDMRYIMETIDNFSDEYASKLFKTDKDTYSNLSLEEKQKLVENFIKSESNPLEKLLTLPSRVEIPEDVEKDDISDWLTDYYEASHGGFELITE